MRRRSCESDTPSCVAMYVVVCNDGSSALMVVGLLQIPLAMPRCWDIYIFIDCI